MHTQTSSNELAAIPKYGGTTVKLPASNGGIFGKICISCFLCVLRVSAVKFFPFPARSFFCLSVTVSSCQNFCVPSLSSVAAFFSVIPRAGRIFHLRPRAHSPHSFPH